MEKVNVRVFFEKKGRAVFISHLDLMRTMQRAIKRSGLPVWYSEGFNPRIYLNFPLALSLGVEGTAEPMDFGMISDVSMEDIVNKLDAACPEGIHILSAAYPVYHNKEIGFAEYTADFEGEPSVLAALFDEYMAQETIEVEKHSKRKGMITLDIKPHLSILESGRTDNGLRVSFRMPAGIELNLNAAILIDSFISFCGKKQIFTENICAKRTNILCKNLEVFA